ncbi:MAG: hypothetical protein FJ088_08150, partial [Deltaproteobacteria bacterium]|nr:hypothetical protein [Deltaproteobacteria bacterium]
MNGRAKVFIILCAGFFAFRAAHASAQCSGGGSYLGSSCLGVSFTGCCGAYGDVKWCENGALCSLNCKPTPVCGWRPAEGIYDCGTEGSADPSGTNPYFCKISCGSVSDIGCCETNSLLKFCSNGTLEMFDCAKNASAEKFCGWDSAKSFYNCVVSPKPGPQQYPYQCGGSCTPNCAGKQCGPDGCNGECGFCKANEKCNVMGQCEPAGCIPDCLGKECGPDGCGFSCGTCGGKEVCSEEFKCIIEPCKPECSNKECGSNL